MLRPASPQPNSSIKGEPGPDFQGPHIPASWGHLVGCFPSAPEGLCGLQVLFSGAVTSVAHLYPLQGHIASELTLSQLPTATISDCEVPNPREEMLWDHPKTRGFLWSSIGGPSSHTLADLDHRPWPFLLVVGMFVEK